MGTRTIEQTWEHICDHCGCQEITGMVKVPKGWGSLSINEPLYYGEGPAPAIAGTGVTEAILCAVCLKEVRDALAALLEVSTIHTIHIVFDGPPGAESGRFVEVEDTSGKSISVGSWHDRKDGGCELIIPRVLLTIDDGKTIEDGG